MYIVRLLVGSALAMLILLGCSRSVDRLEQRITHDSNASVRRLANMEETVHNLQFSPNGEQLAVANSGGLWICHANGKTQLSTLTGHEGPVLAVAWLDNKTLASGGEDKIVRLWDAKTFTLLKTLKGHTGRVNALAFSPDGKTLASGSRYKQEYPMSPDDSAEFLLEEPTELSSDLNDRLKYFAEQEKKQEKWSEIREQRRTGLPIDLEMFDNTVRIWNCATGEPKQTFGKLGTHLAYANAKTIASASVGPSAVEEGHSLLDIRTGRSGGTNIFNGENNKFVSTNGTLIYSVISAVAFSPDCSRVALARSRVVASRGRETYQEGQIKLVMTGDGSPTYIDVESLVTAMAFSRGGNYLALGNIGKGVQLLDVKGSKVLHELEERTVGVTALAFSADGQLACGNRAGEIFLWPPSAEK